jgi:hypothetical protein
LFALIWVIAAVGAADADRFADGEETIGPDYADAPELTVKEGIPRGTVHEFTMDSKDSKIYPGIAKRQPGVVPGVRRWSPRVCESTSDILPLPPGEGRGEGVWQ